MSVIQLFKMILELFTPNIIERRDDFTHFIFLDHQKILKLKKSCDVLKILIVSFCRHFDVFLQLAGIFSEMYLYYCMNSFVNSLMSKISTSKIWNCHNFFIFQIFLMILKNKMRKTIPSFDNIYDKQSQSHF